VRQAVHRVEFLRNGKFLDFLSKNPNKIFALQTAVNNEEEIHYTFNIFNNNNLYFLHVFNILKKAHNDESSVYLVSICELEFTP
jgi:hypothetical protein